MGMTLTTEKLIFLAENAHFEVHQGWTASIVPVTLYTRGKEEGRMCSSVNKTFSTVCLRFFCSYVFCFFLVVWLIFFLGGAFFFFFKQILGSQYCISSSSAFACDPFIYHRNRSYIYKYGRHIRKDFIFFSLFNIYSIDATLVGFLLLYLTPNANVIIR